MIPTKSFLKRNILSVVFVLLFSTCFGQRDYWNYPTIEFVAKAFFHNYSFDNTYDYPGVRFEKKFTGWHVVIYDQMDPDATPYNQLFWSRKDDVYNELSYLKTVTKSDEEVSEILHEYVTAYDQRFFNLLPTYGYSDWHVMTINLLESVDPKTDTVAYALGRAHSYYATELISNNSAPLPIKDHFYPPTGANSLSKEQLEKYRYHRHKAIAYFKMTMDINPDFQTFIGSIDNKLSNEYVTAFLDLRMFQNEEEAIQELEGCQYPDFFISFAKNYLMSCPKNAILFTEGDNDTYPLLYVQSKLGYRKDVVVVNLSLLNLPRYANSLTRKVAGRNPIDFLLSENNIERTKAVLLEKNEDKRITLKQFFEFIADTNHINHDYTQPISYAPTHQLEMMLNHKKIQWNVQDNIIMRSDVLVLDIIENHKDERPICFVSSTSSSRKLGLTPFLQQRGLVVILTSDIEKYDDNLPIDVPVTYQLLTESFVWEGIRNPDKNQYNLSLGNKLLFIHSKLSDRLIEQSKNDSALKILDQTIAIFPNDVIAYNRHTLPIIGNLYELDKNEQAHDLAMKLIDNYKNKDLGLAITEDPEVKEFFISVITYFAETYDDPDLIKALKE